MRDLISINSIESPVSKGGAPTAPSTSTNISILSSEFEFQSLWKTIVAKKCNYSIEKNSNVLETFLNGSSDFTNRGRHVVIRVIGGEYTEMGNTHIDTFRISSSRPSRLNQLNSEANVSVASSPAKKHHPGSGSVVMANSRSKRDPLGQSIMRVSRIQT